MDRDKVIEELKTLEFFPSISGDAAFKLHRIREALESEEVVAEVEGCWLDRKHLGTIAEKRWFGLPVYTKKGLDDICVTVRILAVKEAP